MDGYHPDSDNTLLFTQSAIKDIHFFGSGFPYCNNDSIQFHLYVPEPEYRAQIVHHISELSMNRDLMVYNILCALPTSMILLNFSQAERESVLSLLLQLCNI